MTIVTVSYICTIGLLVLLLIWLFQMVSIRTSFINSSKQLLIQLLYHIGRSIISLNSKA